MKKRWEKCTPNMHRTAEVSANKIVFSPCGVTSPHPEDIRHRFCAYCDRFIPEVKK